MKCEISILWKLKSGNFSPIKEATVFNENSVVPVLGISEKFKLKENI